MVKSVNGPIPTGGADKPEAIARKAGKPATTVKKTDTEKVLPEGAQLKPQVTEDTVSLTKEKASSKEKDYRYMPAKEVYEDLGAVKGTLAIMNRGAIVGGKTPGEWIKAGVDLAKQVKENGVSFNDSPKDPSAEQAYNLGMSLFAYKMSGAPVPDFPKR